MRRKEKTVDTKIKTELRKKHGIEYKYELIMRESAQVASYKLPLYSVSVEMTYENGVTTTAETKEVFADAGRAIAFFERVVDNMATPGDLAYIVEEELAK